MQVDAFLNEHEVFDYSAADFEQDRETLRELRMRKLGPEPVLSTVVIADTSFKMSGAKLLGVYQHSDNSVAGQSAMALGRFPGNSTNVANQIVRRSRDATFWQVKAS